MIKYLKTVPALNTLPQHVSKMLYTFFLLLKKQVFKQNVIYFFLFQGETTLMKMKAEVLIK